MAASFEGPGELSWVAVENSVYDLARPREAYHARKRILIADRDETAV